MSIVSNPLSQTSPAGAGQIDVVIFGSSTDEHCHVSLNGTLKVVKDSGTDTWIGTFVVNMPTPPAFNPSDKHLLTHGVPIFLGNSKPDLLKPEEDYRWFGIAKVLSDNTLQMNLTTNAYNFASSPSASTNWPVTTGKFYPNDRISMGCHFLTSWCATSWYKELYRRFPGRAFNLITTYALGGQTVALRRFVWNATVSFDGR